MRTILLIVSLFLAFESFAQVNLTNGLVAYYPFNGNAKDESGNGNHPVYNNATLTNDKFGNTKSAYHFNGTSNYIKIPNSNSLQIGNKISLCMNVKVSDFYKGACKGNSLIMKGDADYLEGNMILRFSDFVTGCSTGTSTDNEQFYGSSYTGAAVAKTSIIKKEKWYSIIYTFDGTVHKLYIDCILQGKAIDAQAANYSNNADLFLGRLNDYKFPYWFNGDIDEVRIYNRALNESEILALCNNKKTIENTEISVELEYSITNCNTVNFKAANPKNIKTVKWQLGDKTTNTKEKFIHTYKKDGTYDVTLVVTGNDGQTRKITKTIVIQKPITNFSYKSSNNPLIIQFKNTSKEKVNYKWIFGDGENLKSNATKSFTHKYTEPGTYIVQLIAEDNTGCLNTSTQEVVIEKPTIAASTNIGNYNEPKTIAADNIPMVDILPEKRINNLVRQIEVTNDSIQVSFYDNGDIDGDSITVSYNNKIITQHLLLTANGKTFTIKVEPAPYENELIMYAENLGSIPPNTALMIIYDGAKRYEVNISSTNESNGKVSFKLKR